MVDPQAISDPQIRINRRSNASASIPPYRPAKIIGISANAPTSATARVESVNA